MKEEEKGIREKRGLAEDGQCQRQIQQDLSYCG
jgi:hypothetical protein